MEFTISNEQKIVARKLNWEITILKEAGYSEEYIEAYTAGYATALSSISIARSNLKKILDNKN